MSATSSRNQITKPQVGVYVGFRSSIWQSLRDAIINLFDHVASTDRSPLKSDHISVPFEIPLRQPLV